MAWLAAAIPVATWVYDKLSNVGGDEFKIDETPKPVDSATSQGQAPQIPSSSGIGSNLGGPTAESKALDDRAEKLAAEKQGMNQEWVELDTRIRAANKAYADAVASGNTYAADKWGAEYKRLADESLAMSKKNNARIKEIDAEQADIAGQKKVEASDVTRFGKMAEDSYNRPHVRPGTTQVNKDIGAVDAQGNQLGDQITSLLGDKSGAGQDELIARLKGDLSGAAPSLAQAQLSDTTEKNLAAQRSMVATAGPMDYGAASRASIFAGANTQQQAVRDAAILRAKEYADARGELGSVLGKKREGDVQIQKLATDAMVQRRAQELTKLGLSYQDAMNKALLEVQQMQLDQQREQSMLGFREGTLSREQTGDIADVNAKLDQERIASGNFNTEAGIYNTNVNAANEQADRDARERAATKSAIGTGIGAYSTSQTSPTPSSQPTAQPRAGGYYTPDSDIQDPWKDPNNA